MRARQKINSIEDVFSPRYCEKSPSGCWLWIGRLNADGYGFFTKKHHTIGAHRFVYEQLKGSAEDYAYATSATFAIASILTISSSEHIRITSETCTPKEGTAGGREALGSPVFARAAMGSGALCATRTVSRNTMAIMRV